jgi:hypothetical protein
MLEILHFIFSSFWIWLGTVILVGIIVYGVADIVRAFKTKNVTNVFNGLKQEEIEEES